MPNPQILDEVMTRSPRTLPSSSTVRQAAQEMKRASVGSIVVESEGKPCGIVTDRDIVVRCVAIGGNCDEMSLGSICTQELSTLSPRDSVDQAVQLMRSKAVRRIPVVEDGGRVVGIVSLGDLARVRDPRSALGSISAASPNS
jgi:CBS domain-containing protein